MVLFERKKRYSKISYEKRLSLINLVDQQKITISKAAKRLRIKLPTAKVILRNYRKKGKILNKKRPQRGQHPREDEVKVEPEESSLCQVSEVSIEEKKQEPNGGCFYWMYCPLMQGQVLFFNQ